MNRKQRRARDAQIRKDGNEDLAAQVAMFGKLPEECTACEIPYDKKNKEMATTWNVVAISLFFLSYGIGKEIS